MTDHTSRLRAETGPNGPNGPSPGGGGGVAPPRPDRDSEAEELERERVYIARLVAEAPEFTPDASRQLKAWFAPYLDAGLVPAHDEPVKEAALAA